VPGEVPVLLESRLSERLITWGRRPSSRSVSWSAPARLRFSSSTSSGSGGVMRSQRRHRGSRSTRSARSGARRAGR